MRKWKLEQLIRRAIGEWPDDSIRLGNKIYALDERVAKLERVFVPEDDKEDHTFIHALDSGDCFVDGDGNAHMPAPKPKPRGPMLEAPENNEQIYELHSDGTITAHLWIGSLFQEKLLVNGVLFASHEAAELVSERRKLNHDISVWANRNGWAAEDGGRQACLWFDKRAKKWKLAIEYSYEFTPGVVYFDPDDFDALIDEFGPRLEVLL